MTEIIAKLSQDDILALLFGLIAATTVIVLVGMREVTRYMHKHLERSRRPRRRAPSNGDTHARPQAIDSGRRAS